MKSNNMMSKTFRALKIYDLLSKGLTVDKELLSEVYGVSKKSIQRDLDEIRDFLDLTYPEDDTFIMYNKLKNKYELSHTSENLLTKQEALAIIKVLLESRAFTKNEINRLTDKLTHQVGPQDKQIIDQIAGNELFNYVELNHGKDLLEIIWELTQDILTTEVLEISYERQDGKLVKRIIQPVGLVFSEFYFYLIAYMDSRDDDMPIIYRVDRIKEMTKLNRKFKIPYSDRFKDGEFKKRIQFMYTGKLTKIRFKFWGDSLDAVLDRLPTAKIIGEENNIPIIEAEMYGHGVKKWFLSQADQLEVISPEPFKIEMKDTIKKMYEIYSK